MKRSDLKDLDFKSFIRKIKDSEEYKMCSWGGDKMPEEPYATRPTEFMNESSNLEVGRFTIHKDKNITLHTSRGVIKFWHNNMFEELIEIELQ